VKFIGCTGAAQCGSEYDGGAIRIDDPPSTTLTSASVDVGPCHFAPWGSSMLPATLGAGQNKFILTQTGLLGPPQPAPCDGQVADQYKPFTNFDTSEGPFPMTASSGMICGTAGPAPVIHLTFDNGTTLNITDSAKVLSTGGNDSSFCNGTDEAKEWQLIP
jgi:hypothetical protein